MEVSEPVTAELSFATAAAAVEILLATIPFTKTYNPESDRYPTPKNCYFHSNSISPDSTKQWGVVEYGSSAAWIPCDGGPTGAGGNTPVSHHRRRFEVEPTSWCRMARRRRRRRRRWPGRAGVRVPARCLHLPSLSSTVAGRRRQRPGAVHICPH